MARRITTKKQVSALGNSNQNYNCPRISAKDLGAGDQSPASEDAQVGISNEDGSNSPVSIMNRTAPGKVAQKRKFEDENADFDNDIPNDFSSEMTKLLEGFGTDMNKTLHAKRRRLAQLTQESMRSTSRVVMEATHAQAEERKKLHDEFKRQLFNFVQQGEQEFEKSREAEDKLLKMVTQLSHHQKQIRIAQTQRLKSLRQLSEQFFGGLQELDNKHGSQMDNIQSDLRKEMALLQKRILMDIQQQEMLNVRKSLKSMLI